MPVVTLMMMAMLISVLNRSHYLRDYRTSVLPHFGNLILVLTVPLVLVDHQVPEFWVHLAWLLLLLIGGLASFIDWEEHVLPDRLILPTLLLSTLLLAMGRRFVPAVIGASLWFVGFAFLAIINPTGLGWGDVKLAALLGADCGALDLKLVPVAIFVALSSGGVVALFQIVKGNRRAQIAFGPFLFAGAIAALLGA
ncbi:type 4 prepilin-like protein leader peptide-processing enzyme [mine drainage metagenome]|uniref:Type 4 prepilin-like protein leader peptide-processing enzyme n=1 Tax=mine drainage metagenome TaxID=410659 RepID=A0A1J5P561_9ZZZZ